MRASRELTRHLLALGHARIGFVGGLANVSTAPDRVRGYRLALRAARTPMDPEMLRSGAFKADAAWSAARDLLKREDRPTAIVAGNDLMVLGVLQAAGDLGLRVPGDLAVVGFDDIEILRDPVRFGGQPLQQVLAPTLIVRRTCGALPGSRGRQGGARG